MKATNGITLFAIAVLISGCSSSSGTESNSTGTAVGMDSSDAQSMRLVSRQINFSSGRTRIVSYTYDNAGNLQSLAFDSTTHSYTTNSAGQIVSRAVSFGTGPATTPDDVYYYDPVGGLRRIDFNNASGVRAIELYKFQDGITTNYENRLLDNEVSASQVDENSGIFLNKIAYEYEAGRLIRELIDSNGDGVVDKQRDYSYNPDGTVSTALETGSSPSSYTYFYEQGICNNNWGNTAFDHFCVAINSM